MGFYNSRTGKKFSKFIFMTAISCKKNSTTIVRWAEYRQKFILPQNGMSFSNLRNKHSGRRAQVLHSLSYTILGHIFTIKTIILMMSIPFDIVELANYSKN